MKFLETWVRETARPWLLGVLGAVSLLFLLVFGAVIVPAIEAVTGGPPPDLVLFQTPAELASWLERGGDEVRRLYGWFLVADSLYPVVYGLFFAGLLWWLHPGGKAWHLAVYAVVADYLENAMHAIVLASYPGFPGWAAWVGAVATLLKWAFLLLVVLRALQLAWRRWRQPPG